MTLQDRLRELVDDRDRESAATLAKAAMKNEDVVEVAVGDDGVTVETRRFRGVHRWWTDEDGAVTVDDEGTYTCTCDGVDLSFTVQRMPPAARARAAELLRRRSGADPGEERDSPAKVPRPDGESPPGTAATTGPDDAPGTTRETADEGPRSQGSRAVADGGTANVADDDRPSVVTRAVRWIAARLP